MSGILKDLDARTQRSSKLKSTGKILFLMGFSVFCDFWWVFHENSTLFPVRIKVLYRV
jgi:hypothetical protein